MKKIYNKDIVPKLKIDPNHLSILKDMTTKYGSFKMRDEDIDLIPSSEKNSITKLVENSPLPRSDRRSNGSSGFHKESRK